jgi:plastocyanin
MVLEKWKLLIGLVLVVVLVAASGISCPADEDGEEPEFDVLITATAFVPSGITTNVGSTITWYNQDTQIHTVTAVDQTFNSGNLALGDTFRYTFDETGIFDYYCIPHPYMTGKVIVE